MRYNSFRTSGLDSADGGLFENDLVLKPPPYRPGEADGEEALRLAPPPATPHPPPLRRKKKGGGGVPLPLLMAGWAAVLGAALGVAYITHAPARQLDAQADLPAAPPPSAPTDAELGSPVTAPSIASQSAQFAAAAPAAGTAQQGQAELNIAEAPNPPPLEVKPAPPDPPEPPAVQTAEASQPAPLKVEKAADPASAKPKAGVEKADPPARPKAAKLEKASTESATAKPDKSLAAKGAAAPAKDLPQLKARMNRAYAEAVKAGTPKSVLRARQAEWAVLRARAEKKGPAAVEALYRTRAAQLEAIAKKSAHAAHSRA